MHRGGVRAWCGGTGHELVASEPDGDRTSYRIRRGDRAALMFKDLPDWGIRAPIRTDGEGFDTKDWLMGKAGLIPDDADPATGFSPRGAVVEFPFPPVVRVVVPMLTLPPVVPPPAREPMVSLAPMVRETPAVLERLMEARSPMAPPPLRTRDPPTTLKLPDFGQRVMF
jgi:hypothetical protein